MVPTLLPPSESSLDERSLLHGELLSLFDAHALRPALAGAWPTSLLDAATFDRLALRVARFQLEHNTAYRRYTQRLGVDPDHIVHPFDAPPIPTDAFKRAALTTFDPDDAVACFRSSGTTAADRGRHYLRQLTLARASIVGPFMNWMLPDIAADATVRVLVLAPTGEDAPDSSLCFMLDLVRQRFGDDASQHVVDRAGGLDMDRLVHALDRAVIDGVPTFLMGPSFAYVHALDGLGERHFALPAGSRIFETGGLKGRARTVSRDVLHRELSATFGVLEHYIAGEYGMSELSSQLYEHTLRHALRGKDGPWGALENLYVPPPWCAVRVLDPIDLQPLPPGQLGQIALFDLANLDSVAHVITGDMGILITASAVDECLPAPIAWQGLPEGVVGVRLLGRAEEATPKGCSIAVDALLSRDPDEGIWL